MKNLNKLSLITLLLLLTSIAYSLSFSGEVVRVLDGDTIDMQVSEDIHRIRLEGIDCPETNQSYGKEATDFVIEACLGKVVTAKVKEKDRYGRYIAEIILKDGRSLNEELVRVGLAWHYKQFNDEQRYADLENKAREKRIG